MASQASGSSRVGACPTFGTSTNSMSGFACFITATVAEDVITHLHNHGVMIEQGPVPRTGALGPIRSVYCRDPDGNLVEIASYLPL